MTGFSPAWLKVREAADSAARHPAVLKACAAAFSGRGSLAVCDVGAGTGASIRAFADLLPGRQTWTLVDHDAANLAAAGTALKRWADRTEGDQHTLILRHGARRIEVVRVRHDLAPQPHCWRAGIDLVVATAFLDLASAEWIGRFVGELAADRLPLLATLTFDGTLALDPPHRLDAAIAAAFTAHQGRDKGFGPAAGPRAADVLVARLRDAGYRVTEGESPWRLDRSMTPLRTPLIEGIGAAVAETGVLDPVDMAAWREAALAADFVRVGHRDVFAMPAPSPR